jgi:hypothetical protein
VGAERQHVGGDRGQVTVPVDQHVEELVQPGQDGDDDEGEVQDPERLPGPVGDCGHGHLLGAEVAICL